MRWNEPSVELDDDLAGAVVVNLLELANVACKRSMSVMLRRIISCQTLSKQSGNLKNPPLVY